MRNRSWFGPVFLVVVIFGLFFFLHYKPRSTELRNLKTERVKVEQEVMGLRAKKKDLDKIEAEIQDRNRELKDLELIIPQKKEISDILRKIQQLAYDCLLNITKFAPKEEIIKEFYAESPIAIEITGNYHNLGIFFDRLSRFSRLFNIENFSIKALAKQTDASTISANWTAKTYLFQEESLEPPAPKQKEIRKK